MFPVQQVMLSCSVVSDFLWPPWTIARQAPSLWDSSAKNTGVGCHSLLQGIFLTQGSNLGLLHCRRFFTNWTTREVHPSMDMGSQYFVKWKTQVIKECDLIFVLRDIYHVAIGSLWMVEMWVIKNISLPILYLYSFKWMCIYLRVFKKGRKSQILILKNALLRFWLVIREIICP